MAHAFLLEEQKWIFGMPILKVYSSVKDMSTTEENFLREYQVTDDNGTVHFTTIYQDGMREEQFTFTIRFVLLTDRRKPSSGQHNCTSTIPSMNKCMNKVLTTIIVLPKQQTKKI
jgi:protocatechuate 3,4-dioxygenase beta subunit